MKAVEERSIKMIPILHNHDPNNIIGTFNNGVVTLNEGLIKGLIHNEGELYDIFGNVGIQIIEQHTCFGFTYVTKFRIIEWSL